MQRVVVSGLGAITPIGDCVADFFSGLLSGASGIVDFREHPEMGGYRLKDGQIPLAGLLPSEAANERFPDDLRRRYDPQTLTVLATAIEALTDAGFDQADRKVAILVGSAVGLRPSIPRMKKSFPAYAQFSSDLLPEPHYYNKNFLDEFATSTVIQAITRECVQCSMAFPFSSLCVSGGNAIILGYELIKAGVVDAALAIGFDFFHPRQNQVFSHFRLLDDAPIKPFDASRTGYQLGESVGAVLLESADTAGKRPYAEIVGVGASCDGYHLVIPDPSGKPQSQAMTTALAEAQLMPNELDAIATIGRGSKVGDQAEGRAIARLLGNSGASVPMNSLVPNIGYTLGASSMMNFIALMMEIRQGILFPTLNVEKSDTRLGKFDLVQGHAKPVNLRSALALGSAFFGSNTAIAVRAPNTQGDAL